MVRWLGVATIGLAAVLPATARATACDTFAIPGAVNCEGQGWATDVIAIPSESDSLQSYACDIGNLQQGPERILELSCATSGFLTLDMFNTDCDIDFFVVADQCNPLSPCITSNTAAWFPGGHYTSTFFCDENVQYYVIVEGWALNYLPSTCPLLSRGGQVGVGSAFSITAVCAEVCDDGFDNDRDGQFDCDDDDCTCGGVEDCDTLGDEDNNGLADCLDPACALTDTCCDVDGDLVFADTPYCGNGGDCDDGDPTVFTGADEVVADGADQDCDGVDDCWRDFDVDGFGDANAIITGDDLDCSNLDGEASNDLDCDDLDGLINPLTSEVVADGEDQDCDDVDTCYRDRDFDGIGGPDTFDGDDLDCSNTLGESIRSDDCDDLDGTVRPGVTELPADGVDQNCDGDELCYRDRDSDGYGGTATVLSTDDLDCDDGDVSDRNDDCDDDDSQVNPGIDEVVADGADQDCDDVDDCWRDLDRDGVGGATSAPGDDLDCTNTLGESALNTDCLDTNDAVFPGADEIPADGIDQDCDNADHCYRDGDQDDFGAGAPIAGDDLDCTNGAREADNDLDCLDSDPDAYPGATEVPYDGIDQDCADGDLVDRDFDGFAGGLGGPDCDDVNPFVNPDAVELPVDGVDQDCDGRELCFQDLDHDGYGTPTTILGDDLDCANTLGESVRLNDCADEAADVPVGVDPASVYPGAPEVPYDGVDQDCVDGDLSDADGDGFPGGPGGSDCNDFASAVNPGASEGADAGDGIDQDCNGLVDDGTLWFDDDGDGYSEAGGDCDDADPARHPGAQERGNGVDDDCDGGADEGTALVDDDDDGY